MVLVRCSEQSVPDAAPVLLGQFTAQLAADAAAESQLGVSDEELLW